MPLQPWSHGTYSNAFSGKRALITGGAGFIGSHLSHALTSLGCKVVVLDALKGGSVDNLPAAVEFHKGSILDDALLTRVVTGADFVFHQAALVSVPESVEKPDECLAVNIEGTQRVLIAAQRAGVKRVNFAASAAAYGNSPSLPSKETDAPDAWSPYAASKVAGELLLQTWSRCFNVSTVSLRYFNVFGPRQDPKSPYAAVISAFVNALSEGRQPRIMGDGLQTRDFVYIDNIVHANLLAASSPRDLHGEVINIGCGGRVTLLDVLASMGRTLRVDATPTHTDPRAGDVRHSSADISKAASLLGYSPVVGFDEGIRRTLAWACPGRIAA
ncbi:MAG: NAD-dependent epimerase/dehydratase family protein [Planctomycetes bacterium]|nr:NAD-dependent epimerase/dehydratase family protein [Planctomycetota bacterium]